MSNTPDNPSNPSPQDKGPWLYSGAQQPQPTYVPPAIPTPAPQQPASPATESPVSLTPPPPPPPPAPPKKPPAPQPKPQTKSDDASLASIVDTIEAIIIALILALTFRAFIVEAFVIPTGSMAPTLLGAHFNVICPACGYTYTRNASLRYQLVTAGNGTQRVMYTGDHAELISNRIVPAEGEDVTPLICPNCQYQIPYARLPQYLGSATVEDHRPPEQGQSRSVPFAWANNGDRILVLKYLYALFEPHRFDVIVFKEPMNARDNYIKRLIALPGETVEVINGDIFVAPPGKSASEDLLIARKPAYLQKNVWQLIYNNDYYPTDEGDARSDGTVWNNPWSGTGPTSANWNIHGPAFQYAAKSPGTTRFNVRDQYTYNILGYDNDSHESTGPARGRTLLRCGDLRLETVWTPDNLAATSITLTVGQKQNLFKATWNTDGLDLQQFNSTTHLYNSVEKIPASQLPPLQAQHAYHIALDNVDHTVRFFIDDSMVLEHITKWSAVDALREMGDLHDTPDPFDNVTKPDIQIDVGGKCTLAHTKLFRDLYYTQNEPNQTGPIRTANANNPLTLNSDEFFAMGDNSRDSLDGRMWNSVYPPLDDLGTREGIVPRRYLLGKAFFVYWPAGYRPDPTDSIPQPINIPIIPNAGDMRLIR